MVYNCFQDAFIWFIELFKGSLLFLNFCPVLFFTDIEILSLQILLLNCLFLSSILSVFASRILSLCCYMHKCLPSSYLLDGLILILLYGLSLYLVMIFVLKFCSVCSLCNISFSILTCVFEYKMCLF